MRQEVKFMINGSLNQLGVVTFIVTNDELTGRQE